MNASSRLPKGRKVSVLRKLIIFYSLDIVRWIHRLGRPPLWGREEGKEEDSTTMKDDVHGTSRPSSTPFHKKDSQGKTLSELRAEVERAAKTATAKVKSSEGESKDHGRNKGTRGGL
jgi:hypothetical protein